MTPSLRFLKKDPERAISVQELLKNIWAFKGETRDIGELLANLNRLVESEVELSQGPTGKISSLFDAITQVQTALLAKFSPAR